MLAAKVLVTDAIENRILKQGLAAIIDGLPLKPVQAGRRVIGHDPSPTRDVPLAKRQWAEAIVAMVALLRTAERSRGLTAPLKGLQTELAKVMDRVTDKYVTALQGLPRDADHDRARENTTLMASIVDALLGPDEAAVFFQQTSNALAPRG